MTHVNLAKTPIVATKKMLVEDPPEILVMSRTIARQIPLKRELTQEEFERMEVLGRIANHAIEDGSMGGLVVKLDGEIMLVVGHFIDTRVFQAVREQAVQFYVR